MSTHTKTTDLRGLYPAAIRESVLNARSTRTVAQPRDVRDRRRSRDDHGPGLRDLMAGVPGADTSLHISAWLWLCVLFANFTEALAEGRGKARADTLRATKADTGVMVLPGPDSDPADAEAVASVDLHPGQFILLTAGSIIPTDGEVVRGVASVNESAITGETAPVIREAGGDRSSVTGGDDRGLGLAGDAGDGGAGEKLPRPDDRACRRGGTAKDPERDRAEHPSGGPDADLPVRRRHATRLRQLLRQRSADKATEDLSVSTHSACVSPMEKVLLDHRFVVCHVGDLRQFGTNTQTASSSHPRQVVRMRAVSQIVVVALIAVVAIPLSARFVPGTRPWLDQLGLLAPLSAAGLVPESAAPEKGPQAQASGQRGVVVAASELTRESLLDEILAIGSARGVRSVELSFEVTGRLRSVLVAPGDLVAEGDVIADLDAEAAQLAVDRARLVLDDRRKTLERLDQLSQSGSTTALQRQDAELALRTAELELQSAERDLADHRLVAPVAGYVGLIEPQIGDLVSSATTITRIEDRSSLLLDFRVPERVAALIGPGDSISASAISTPGETVEGRIVAVDNRVEEASRTLRVQAQITNPEDQLRAGMAFQISLVFTGAEHPSVDPLAIQWSAEGAFVWVVRDQKAERVPIRILQRNARTVLIEADFQPTDLVVTEGVQALRPGADVTLAPRRS